MNNTTSSEQLYIELLNGKRLACYPLEQQPETVEPTNLSLDTTGEYLVIGTRKPRRKGQRPGPSPEEQELRQLLTSNAFYLLEHADRIMSDSRLFLAPVDLGSHLAYVGRGGFKNSTLGVYIEWWLTCEGAQRLETPEHPELVFLLAGSPLSGNNSCGVVDKDGNSRHTWLKGFPSMWRPFVTINRRYSEAAQRSQRYTLQEVIDILKSED